MSGTSGATTYVDNITRSGDFFHGPPPVDFAAVRPDRPRRVSDVVGAVVAWLVIAAVAGFLVYRNATAAPRAVAGDGAAVRVTAELEGRYLVGLAHVTREMEKANPAAAKPENRTKLVDAAAEMNTGPYAQRLRYVILVGELNSPAEALANLDALSGKGEASEQAVEAGQLLGKLYAGYKGGKTDSAAILTDAEREKLRTSLGWYGSLALAPEGGDATARAAVTGAAMRTALVIGAAVMAFSLLLVVGVVALGIVLVQTWRGKMGPALTTGATRGGVYAETFALYLLLFFGLSFGMSFISFRGYGLLAVVGAMFLSLIVLAWPVLRGVPWSQVREEIGLNFGGKPVTSVLLGFVTYVTALPLLGLSLVLVTFLTRYFKLESPGHPVVGEALEGGWQTWVQLFLVASVGAPIIEEIMFRGVLYRHLRELTGGAGRWWSVAAAVVVTGFVFAVIHPQGWLGVPLLMGLATSFAITREYQRSLVPCIVAHAINNGAVLALLMFMMAN